MNSVEIIAHWGAVINGPDVVAYNAIHRTKQAQARAVHLHPSQLSVEVVNTIRQQGIQIHAWDVNSTGNLRRVREMDITRICTDDLIQALQFFQKN